MSSAPSREPLAGDSVWHIPRRKPLGARVGIFAVGHHTYWDQFDGLLDELLGYHRELISRIRTFGVDVTDFGMVDKAEVAYPRAREIKAGQFDLVFCNMLTYATSACWGVMARELDVPVVLVALQPLKAMDYTRASTYMQLCNDNICSLFEFGNVSARLGRSIPPVIIGHLTGDESADAELREWCSIARVLHDLRGARLGQMGHSIEAMLDMHHDATSITSAFGAHVVMCEPDEVMAQFEEVSDKDAGEKEKEILEFFETPDPKSDPVTRRITPRDLAMAAKTAVALERFVDEKLLDGLAYYYEATEGSPMRDLVTSFIVGNSMLTAAGFPMCGENDLKTCVGMLIMDRLEIGGSFAEFHPVDFEEGFVLVGHDGPHHLNIADRKPVLRSLRKYHGKPGSGASVEFRIREGPITMLGVTQKRDGRFKFVIAEGQSVNGPIPPTGNTNTRGFFRPDVRTFLKRWYAEGPTHHFALGIGRHSGTLEKIGAVLGIESVTVMA